MQEKIIGIYKITNLENKKFYIGSSNNILNRWREHVNDLNANRHANSLLQNAWNKYKQQNFKFEIIKILSNEVELLNEEQIILDCLKPYEREIGYNLALIAKSPMRGRKHSSESIQKQIINQSGINHWNYGNKLTDEHKEKIRLSLGGLTEQQEKKLLDDCKQRKLKIIDICKKYNIGKTCFYRILKKNKFNNKRKRINHSVLD